MRILVAGPRFARTWTTRIGGRDMKRYLLVLACAAIAAGAAPTLASGASPRPSNATAALALDGVSRAFPAVAPSPAGCAVTNGTDVQIADLSTVESPITITGCPGNASADRHRRGAHRAHVHR